MKRLSRKFSVCVPAAVLLSSLLAPHVQAQYAPQGQAVGNGGGAGAGGLEIASVTGSLEAFAGNQLKIKTEDDQEYFAILNNRTTLRYKGTADAKFLRPGLLVRFSAPFDAAGVPQAALQALEVFKTVRQRRMSRDLVQSQTPGIYPVAEKKGEKAKSDVPAAGGGSQNFRVVGQLRALQGEKIQVAVGNRPVIVELDPAAKISVAAGDTSFCLQGDAVEVSGLRNPAREQWIQAEAIVITGANPLGATEDKAPGRNARTRRGKLGERGADGKAPKAGQSQGKGRKEKTADRP